MAGPDAGLDGGGREVVGVGQVGGEGGADDVEAVDLAVGPQLLVGGVPADVAGGREFCVDPLEEVDDPVDRP